MKGLIVMQMDGDVLELLLHTFLYSWILSH